MSKPLAIDLFCGLGGWTEGLLAEGYHARGYDIEAHEYGDEKYPGELILADVMTLHGSQFADAALIVASPPCQEFSYMAMPWSRAKQIAAALRGKGEFPEGYRGSRTIAELTALFDACFRIQREASAAAGRHIPMVVENVRGAVPWVGPAAWNYGSYYLWGDVPALMPATLARKTFGHPNKRDGHGHTKRLTNPSEHCICPTECDCQAPDAGLKSFECPEHNHDPDPVEGCPVHDPAPDGRKNPGFRFDGSGKSFQSESVARHVSEGRKHHGDWFNDPSSPSRQGGQSKPKETNRHPAEGRKQGGDWFSADSGGISRTTGSKSPARKAASAKIAKIPLPLSSWIARTYKPKAVAA